ncbi:MAG: hypothetical protein AAFQ53_03095 [Bacteroidota bacterium]
MLGDLGMRAVFAANVVVAGIVGFSSLFTPARATQTVFEGTASPGAAMGVTGAFWVTVALLSSAGLVWPTRMAPVLLVQLCYKALWLAFFAAPAWQAGRPVPSGIASFFAIWVVVLPFVIPWRALFGAAH